MLARLKEAVLPLLIGFIVHKSERLTQKEKAAEENVRGKLEVSSRKVGDPLVVAMIGLVGSGKSSVAKELASHLEATVIEGDDIRVALRKQGERYERTRAIAENVAFDIAKGGNNAVIDSDFIDAYKRASIREKARKAGVRLVFVRTHCDLDVMLGRVGAASYREDIDDFFGGADSKWRGSGQSKGAVVKIREMVRRLPHHYRWENKGGGKWVLRKLPFRVFDEIDTTDPEGWKRDVALCAASLNRL